MKHHRIGIGPHPYRSVIVISGVDGKKLGRCTTTKRLHRLAFLAGPDCTFRLHDKRGFSYLLGPRAHYSVVLQTDAILWLNDREEKPWGKQ
jgi:hypothetical protein